jgi:acyl-CoA thioester hydrolase
MSENDKFKFFHPLRVRYAETDAQARVFFGNYLTYFDVALTEYLRKVGFSYPEMVRKGIDIFYVEANCQYKGAAFFDDQLHVYACVSHIGNTSLTFEFKIIKIPNEELITTGHIAVVTVNKETEKPIRVPDDFREAIAQFEGRARVE